ncbi:MAG: (d)CMP kinase [Nitrospinota bacterium]
MSAISVHPAVRERVTALLRRAAEERDLVCEGRDIGTVVFPDAALKVFLVPRGPAHDCCP